MKSGTWSGTVNDCRVLISPGAIERLGKLVTRHAPAHAYVLVSDSNVHATYGAIAAEALEQSRKRVERLTFPAGETYKTRETWAWLTDQLFERGLGRDSCIVALGGGVTTDLAGFVAATYMRGIPVVHVPTTLLAMIDAAIGGKTGVDTSRGKNLIGAFHQPRAVIIDPLVLRTLPDEELTYGLAEAVKHGAIADAEYVAWIRDAVQEITERKPDTLTALIRRSVEIKAKFVKLDMREEGARAVLNFGHTIAHGLELASSYTVAHGAAVALGMLAETRAGEQAGITQPGTAEELRSVLAAVRLPTRFPATYSAEALLSATRGDKKARLGQTRFSLLAHMGEVARDSDGAWTFALGDDVVNAAVTQLSAV